MKTIFKEKIYLSKQKRKAHSYSKLINYVFNRCNKKNNQNHIIY